MDDISALCQRYSELGISRDSVATDPNVQFAAWFDEAVALHLPQANAFSLVTASPDGAPTQRTVLLKGHDKSGFIFYTNHASRKGRQLAENNRVSMLFPWYALHRQVIIEGTANRVDAATSEAYFHSRPRASRIGAWASRQSEEIPCRAVLEQRVECMQARFGDGDIPLPEFWGGYRVVARRMEFWQGRGHRLHDRIVYCRENGDWVIKRLSP